MRLEGELSTCMRCNSLFSAENGLAFFVESAEAFNFAMIDKAGVVGVHFPGCIRYAVCADVAAMEDGLRKAFQAADVGYD